MLQTHTHLTAAIDGRCAAGKTTLATELQKRLSPCNLFHMDDFFLRPAQRTAARLQTAGENIDHERFLQEVLLSLKKGEAFSYAPYDCHTQSLRTPIEIMPSRLSIVEGSYACHQSLLPFYDLRIFLDVDKKTQANRLLAREGGEGAVVFFKQWIPLEEAYFALPYQKKAYDIRFKL